MIAAPVRERRLNATVQEYEFPQLHQSSPRRHSIRYRAGFGNRPGHNLLGAFDPDARVFLGGSTVVGCSGGLLPDRCCRPGVSIGSRQRHDRIGDNVGDTIDLQLGPEGRLLDRRGRLSVDLSPKTDEQAGISTGQRGRGHGRSDGGCVVVHLARSSGVGAFHNNPWDGWISLAPGYFWSC